MLSWWNRREFTTDCASFSYFKDFLENAPAVENIINPDFVGERFKDLILLR